MRDKRERERDVRDIERESERERHRALPYRVCTFVDQRKVDYKNYVAITTSRNYYRKLSQEIIN